MRVENLNLRVSVYIDWNQKNKTYYFIKHSVNRNRFCEVEINYYVIV